MKNFISKWSNFNKVVKVTQKLHLFLLSFFISSNNNWPKWLHFWSTRSKTITSMCPFSLPFLWLQSEVLLLCSASFSTLQTFPYSVLHPLSCQVTYALSLHRKLPPFSPPTWVLVFSILASGINTYLATQSQTQESSLTRHFPPSPSPQTMPKNETMFFGTSQNCPVPLHFPIIIAD